MPKKIIKFGTDARKAIQTGINTVVNAVKTSYGPAGRTTVIASSYGAPTITNDGVTIAKAVELEGLEQMGVALIQQAANKTNDVAGDGTSLTTILTGAMVNEGIRVVEAGSDAVKVRSGMQKAVNFALDKLNSMATPVNTKEERANVAQISSRSSEIAIMIAEILDEVGKNGVVTVQTGDSNKIEKEVTQGMQFDKGYKSPYLVTDTTKMEAISDKPMVLVTDQKVSTIQDVLPILEAMSQMGKKDLVIIADDIEGEALATFVLNKIRGVFNVLPVQAPAFGDRRKEILQDISVLVGATYISTDLGMQLKTATIDDLGKCDRIIMNKDTTTIVGGKGDDELITKRISEINNLIQNTTSDYDKEKLQERLAKLTGGVGVIKVGAASEVEMKELKYVVEDAVNATRAAMAGGVVPGGASTLIRISNSLTDLKTDDEDEQVGINLVQKALLVPFRAIAENSGLYDIAILLKDISANQNSGYNFKTMESVKDMVKSGIIDPKLVVQEAIMNSASIAGSILTTQVAMCNEPKEDQKMPTGMSGGMGMDY
jgi:chaperonin GroEL